MKPIAHLLTVAFVLVSPACTKDSINVGGIPGSGGNGAAASPSGGTATATVSTGGVSGGAGGLGGAAGTGASCAAPNLVANEANDYNIASSLALAPTTVAALTNLTFDWSNTTVDLRGRTLDPAKDIAMVAIWIFALDFKGFTTKLNNDSLTQADLVAVPFVYYPDGSKQSAKLSEFTMNGAPIDLSSVLVYFDTASYPSGSYTYAMMASSGKILGQGTLMIQAFFIDGESPDTTVAMTPASTTLTFAADLRSLTPMAVPVGQAALALDFGRMTKNALGFDWHPGSVTSAVIGRYTQSLDELESSSFLNLDRVATELYQGKVTTTTSVDLATLKSAAGTSFAGVDATGTWLLGLLCDSCHNPVPWYLTVLKPCGSSP